MQKEERSVRPATDKINGYKKGVETIEPGMRGLAKVVKSLFELAYMIRITRVYEPRWLIHEDWFIKDGMQEGIFLHRVDGRTNIVIQQWLKWQNYSGPNNRAEGMREFKPGYLYESLGDQAGFIA